MRSGPTPWVVELKAATGGQGQYYRHAVGQAVLYREFIRKASNLHPWFQSHGLEATECQAVVAFPELRGRDRDRLLSDIQWLGDLFDIAVVPLSN